MLQLGRLFLPGGFAQRGGKLDVGGAEGESLDEYVALVITSGRERARARDN